MPNAPSFPAALTRGQSTFPAGRCAGPVPPDSAPGASAARKRHGRFRHSRTHTPHRIRIAPDVFAMNADGKAEAVSDTTDANGESVKQAIEGCPVAAIRETE